jgi:hypothetical protein
MNGYKTYIIAVASAIWAGVGMYMGWLDSATGQHMIETALLGAAIRHGIATSGATS